MASPLENLSGPGKSLQKEPSDAKEFAGLNHGKLWKSLMHAHLGDFKGLEDKLKQSAGPGAKSVTVAR